VTAVSEHHLGARTLTDAAASLGASNEIWAADTLSPVRVGRAAAVVVVVSMVGAVGEVSATTSASAAPDPSPSPPPSTAPSITTAATSSSPSPATAPPSTAAPTTTLPPGVFNPDCVRVVRTDDSVSLIGDEVSPQVSTGDLLHENGFGREHTIHPGDLLDVCINDVNDINGASRLRPATTLFDDDPAAVQLQQQKLNELFGPFGMTPLAVDGISGPLTRQQLCAARLFLGLPISRSDMAAGGSEQAELLALRSLPVPPGAPADHGRWVLLDMTCQVVIAGSDANGVAFVFPTSTGTPGHETRLVSEAETFRFDPAIDNGGWHDSSEFPAAYDNPLNGNMYKPLYFSDGQAIHGANNVPPQPASKGCARLNVANQDKLLDWLGLGDETTPVWRESAIDLSVTTQGAYLPDP
jgi:hypothetical protein